ncbi:hypothetical protein GCM10009646_65030 [Streptomyces aureus]
MPTLAITLGPKWRLRRHPLEQCPQLIRLGQMSPVKAALVPCPSHPSRPSYCADGAAEMLFEQQRHSLTPSLVNICCWFS